MNTSKEQLLEKIGIKVDDINGRGKEVIEKAVKKLDELGLLNKLRPEQSIPELQLYLVTLESIIKEREELIAKMLRGGIHVSQSKSAFGDMWREYEVSHLPSGYFREAEKIIGKDVLAKDEHALVAIWFEDMIEKLVYCQHGEIIETESISKFRSLDEVGIIELAESEGVKIYHVEL